MVVTTQGLESITAIIGNSGLSVPSHSAIGSGTSVAASGNIALEHEWARNPITSNNLETSKQVTWISDFNSVEISGLVFTEFGLLNDDTTGNLFHREQLGAGSIVFDGDVELQLQTTFKFE
jgi:hypothetical protein